MVKFMMVKRSQTGIARRHFPCIAEGIQRYREKRKVRELIREDGWKEIAEMNEAAIPGLIEALGLGKGDARFCRTYRIQTLAAHALADIGEAAVPKLKSALKWGDELKREMAALALGIISDPSAKQALIDTLEYDPQAKVREMAALALGKLGDKTAADVLTRALEDKDVLVRRRAEKALEKLECADSFSSR